MPHILVVDDESAIRRVLSLTLRSQGYTVDTASNGQEALDRIREMPPDLILLDYLMPVLDGGEVYRSLRADGYTFPVIFLTAAAADVIKRQFPHAELITKPYNIEHLFATIKGCLMRSLRNEEITTAAMIR